jgi:hypothetical protein
MRTTLTLDEKAFDFANQYAAARAIRLGEAVSELILRANEKVAQPAAKPKKLNGVWVFDLPDSAPALTSGEVKAFLEDGA